MFFLSPLWPPPLEGWHSSATSAQPVLQLTQGGGGGLCGLFYLISVSTRASVWCKRVGVSLLPAPTPPPPYLFSLLVSHLDVCEYLTHPSNTPHSSFSPQAVQICRDNNYTLNANGIDQIFTVSVRRAQPGAALMGDHTGAQQHLV